VFTIELVKMNVQIGDSVCFGERLGDFGKIQYKVIGIEKRTDGLYIRTTYSNDCAPVSMFQKCS
jgi:hypothetical protein